MAYLIRMSDLLSKSGGHVKIRQFRKRLGTKANSKEVEMCPHWNRQFSTLVQQLGNTSRIGY